MKNPLIIQNYEGDFMVLVNILRGNRTYLIPGVNEMRFSRHQTDFCFKVRALCTYLWESRNSIRFTIGTRSIDEERIINWQTRSFFALDNSRTHNITRSSDAFLPVFLSTEIQIRSSPGLYLTHLYGAESVKVFCDRLEKA